MFILYDFIFLIFSLFYLPIMIAKGKWHAGMKQRFGFLDRVLVERLSARPNIWIHAVSVGEVGVAVSLIEGVRQRYPGMRIVVTTVTPTGQAFAHQRLGEDAVICFAPLDFSWVVRKYAAVIRPQVYISTETEIWPNLFSALFKKEVPVIVVNGRISDRAFPRYSKIAFFLRPLLSRVKLFCMQSRQDAQRIINLGARKESVEVTGNIKFDDAPAPVDGRGEQIFKDGVPVLIGGSTHPGEEEVLCQTVQHLQKSFFSLSLILVPRHIERASLIEAVVREHQFHPVLYSQWVLGRKSLLRPDQVLIVDQIGILKKIYQQATVVFVGKSLCGKGGQNMIEPAYFKKPVVVGPHMENFQSILSVFHHANAVIQVESAEELKIETDDLLRNPQEAAELGQRAFQAVLANKGAKERTLQALSVFLSQVSSA